MASTEPVNPPADEPAAGPPENAEPEQVYAPDNTILVSRETPRLKLHRVGHVVCIWIFQDRVGAEGGIEVRQLRFQGDGVLEWSEPQPAGADWPIPTLTLPWSMLVGLLSVPDAEVQPYEPPS